MGLINWNAVLFFTVATGLGLAVYVGVVFKDEKRSVADIFMHSLYSVLFFGKIPQEEVRFDDGTHAEKILATRNRMHPLVTDLIDSSLFTDLTVTMSDGHVNKVRMYHPPGYTKEDKWVRWPVLLYIHGGGFCLGVHTQCDLFLADLAKEANALIFSVEYRLAPEHPYPQACDDILDHYLWLRENAEEYYGDIKRISVGGDSAGGNLAAVLSQDLRDLTMEGKNVGAPVAQILHAPVTDGDLETDSYKEYGKLYGLTQQTMFGFLACYAGVDFSKIKDPRLFPLHGNLSSLPPATVILYNHDPLFSEGEAYYTALKKEGNSAVLHILEGTHVSGTMFPFIFHTEQYQIALKAFTAAIQTVQHS